MNDNYEPLTVVASDGSVGIKRGYTKDDLIARLVELESEIDRNDIAVLPYRTGTLVKYDGENAIINAIIVQNDKMFFQLDAFMREAEEDRLFIIEPDDEKLVVPEREPRPIPEGMSLVKFEFKDEKKRFYPEFDFDNDIKSVEVEEKSIGGFRNGTNKMP